MLGQIYAVHFKGPLCKRQLGILVLVIEVTKQCTLHLDVTVNTDMENVCYALLC